MSTEEKKIINISIAPAENLEMKWARESKAIADKIREAAEIAKGFEDEATAAYLLKLADDLEKPPDISLKPLAAVGPKKKRRKKNA